MPITSFGLLGVLKSQDVGASTYLPIGMADWLLCFYVAVKYKFH